MAAQPTSRCRAFSTGLTLALCTACATYVDEPVVPGSVALSDAGAAGDFAMAGSASMAEGGSSAGGSDGNPAGSAGMPGTSGSLSGSGGTGGSGGAAGDAGSAAGGMAGMAGTGMGGMGGSAAAGGKPSGGAGGSAGAATDSCATRPVPPKTGWKVTASHSNGPDPTSNAYDGDTNDRWSTGKDQSGDEWLQIDFGKDTNLSKLTLILGKSVDDYPRMYQTRISNTALNTALTPQLSGAGQKATDTVMTFPKGTHGRYVLISQKGSVTALWWSVAEIQAECAD